MKKRTTKKITKIFAITAISFVLLFLAAHFLVNLFERAIIDSVIEKIVKKTKSVSSITYDRVDLDLFKKSVLIENLSINRGKDTLDNTATTIPVLKIEGISILKLILHKSLYISRLTIKNGKIIFPGNFYTLKAKVLRFSKAGSSIVINFLELIPKHKKYRFGKVRGYRSNRIRLKVRNITFKTIGIKDLFKKRNFHVKSVRIKNPQIDIFRDKHVPKKTTIKKKKFPQQLLRELKLKIRINNIRVSKGKITYSEHEAGEKNPGKISFSDVQAQLKNLTNYPELLQKNPSLTFAASGKLMGKSLLQVNITIPINDKRNMFKFSGSLGRIRLNEFRSMLENIAHVRSNNAIVNQLTFSAKADNYRAIGEMQLLYNHLKIAVLKKGGSYKKRKFFSFLTNSIIYNDNPKPGKPVRIGKISFKNEGNLSIFGYMWKSLLSGFKSSIGLRKRKKNR
jgi:hypothetical protein